MAVRADEIPVPRGRPRVTGRVRGWLDRESILGPVFVTPALILLLLLVAYPFVLAVYFSSPTPSSAGPASSSASRTSCACGIVMPSVRLSRTLSCSRASRWPFKVVLGIALALLLSQQLWFKRMIRGAPALGHPHRALDAGLVVDVQLALQRGQLHRHRP